MCLTERLDLQKKSARVGREKGVYGKRPVLSPRHGDEPDIREFSQHRIQRIRGIRARQHVAGTAITAKGDLQDVVAPVAREKAFRRDAMQCAATRRKSSAIGDGYRLIASPPTFLIASNTLGLGGYGFSLVLSLMTFSPGPRVAPPGCIRPCGRQSGGPVAKTSTAGMLSGARRELTRASASRSWHSVPVDTLHPDGQYSRGAKWFHWLTVPPIAVMLLSGLTIRFIKDDVKMSFYTLHESLGLLVLLLSVARLMWRWRHTPPALPSHIPAMIRLGAGTVHSLLYVVLIVQPVLGFFTTNALGFPQQGETAFLGFINLPKFMEASPDLALRLHWTHNIVGWC